MKNFHTTFFVVLGLLVVTIFVPVSKGGLQAVHAQETTDKPFRIFAVLWRGETEVEDGFRDYLNQRGIPYELTIRNLDTNRGNAPPIIEEIRSANPDLVYTWGTGTTLSIVGKVETDTPEKFIRDIPGLFVLVAYPQAANIINSYESTGRNMTGVAFLAPIDAQLKTIQAYRPFTKLAAIYDNTSSNSRINIESLREVVPQMNMEFLELAVPLNAAGKPDPATLPGLIEKAKSEGADILYLGPDSFLTKNGDLYTQTAIDLGLPTFASTQAPLKNTRAMFGLVTDYYTLGKLAGVQAERILVKKENPQAIPVALLSRFKLWINMDVVHELGIYPPMDMISIADFKTTAAK